MLLVLIRRARADVLACGPSIRLSYEWSTDEKCMSFPVRSSRRPRRTDASDRSIKCRHASFESSKGLRLR